MTDENKEGAPIIARAKRLLQTADIGKRIEQEEFKPSPPTRGPATGQAPPALLTDRDFVSLFGLDEEFARFRATIERRKEREGTVGWRQLPNGVRIQSSMILAVCDHCSTAVWVRDPSGPCPTCNYRRLVEGGHLRPSTPAEEQVWFAKENAAALHRWNNRASDQEKLDRFNERKISELPRDKMGRL